MSKKTKTGKIKELKRKDFVFTHSRIKDFLGLLRDSFDLFYKPKRSHMPFQPKIKPRQVKKGEDLSLVNNYTKREYKKMFTLAIKKYKATDRHPGGRPAYKYTKDTPGKVDDFLKECEDNITKAIKQKNKGKGYVAYDNILKVKWPTCRKFAVYLGINEDTLYTWAKKHEDFAESLRKIKSIQKERLIENGLADTYNSTITKLILSANHNMVEKSKREVENKLSLIDIYEQAKKQKDEEENEEEDFAW